MTSLLLLGGFGQSLNSDLRADLIGRDVSTLGLAHEGKPTVYIFGQPDCASCSLQLAVLSSLQSRFSYLEFVFVTEDKSPILDDYLGGFALRLKVIADVEGKVVSEADLTTIPATMYVNQGGIIEGFYEGTLDRTEIDRLGKALAAGRSLPLIVSPGDVGSSAPMIKGVDWSKNKDTLVVFYSSTCQFCKEELPHLIDFAHENPEISFLVVAVDSQQDVKSQFLRNSAPSNIDIVDNVSSNSEVNGVYGAYLVEGTPTHVLVDSGGMITWRSSGFNVDSANPFLEVKDYLN